MPRPTAPANSSPADARASGGGRDDLHRTASELYALAEHSGAVFGSPLEPFCLRGRSYHLPRFVYFGPPFSDAAVRLAFLAGFDGTDPRPSQALLELVRSLVREPDLGGGLNLTFFPLVNPSGLAHRRRTNADGVDLAAEHWNLSSAPEIQLLAHDARLRGYHGFVRLESTAGNAITGRVRFSTGADRASTATIVDPHPADRFPVRWEAATRGIAGHGPLTLSDDLPCAPFELTVGLPAAWTPEAHTEAAIEVLKRFITRYRATYAYGLHL